MIIEPRTVTMGLYDIERVVKAALAHATKIRKDASKLTSGAVIEAKLHEADLIEDAAMHLQFLAHGFDPSKPGA